MDSKDLSSSQIIVCADPGEAKSLKSCETNPDFLPLVTPEEFLPSVSRWLTWGGLALLAIFGTAVTLASLLKYKITVKAPAIIRPAGELRIVQALTEGAVKNIAVEPNQLVNKGEAIFYIDDSRLQTQKSQLQGNIQLSQLQLNQINAQIFALDRQIQAETDKLQGTLAAAADGLSLSQRNYQNQQITTAAEVREVEAAVWLAKDELERYQKLAQTGAVSELQLKEKEATLKTAKARLEKMKAYVNPSHAEVAIAEDKIAEERARGEATLAMLNKEREQLIQQRVEIETEIDRERKELKQVEAEITATVVRAPASGIIQELNLRNVSQLVSPGEIIARIAPSDNSLKIKALVASQDINQVQADQEVQMRVSACPYPDYGTLKGTVRAISPDAIMPQDNPASTSSLFRGKIAGVKATNAAYEVTIEPERLTLEIGKRTCTIQSGMEARAEIISREETVLAFILKKTRLIADF